jgi:hypothetical protein
MPPENRPEHPVAPDLVRLQESFQRQLLSGDDAVASAVDDRGVSAAERLAIYSTAYRLRLVDALAANFPRLLQFLERESFDQIARDYIDRFPSRSVSVRWFGDQLPDYLRRKTELLAHPWIAELAAMEWQVAAAFDAADATPLSTAALSRIAPAEWPELRFLLHPAVRQIRLRTNAALIFKALDADSAVPVACLSEQEQAWLIWREALTTRFRRCSDDESQALQTLAQNGTFAAMCDVLCRWFANDEVPARAASLLKTWVVEGLITGCMTDPVGDASKSANTPSCCRAARNDS